MNDQRYMSEPRPNHYYIHPVAEKSTNNLVIIGGVVFLAFIIIITRK